MLNRHLKEFKRKQNREVEDIVEEGDTLGWIMDIVFNFYENEIDLEKLINVLLED